MGRSSSARVEKQRLLFSLFLKKPFLFLLVLVLLTILLWPIPNYSKPYAFLLFSAEGQILDMKIAEDGQWRFPPLDSVPYRFQTALINYEDQYFYWHLGFNPISIVSAAVSNWKQKKIVRGGSTLAMQLSRIVHNLPPRTYGQKLKEVILASKFTLLKGRKYVLQQYASLAPFGGNIVGLTAASWRYFGKQPHQLSWAESALLATLPNSPSKIFPGQKNETLLDKRNKLLYKLYKIGVLKKDEFDLSVAEPIPQQIIPVVRMAPHFLQNISKEEENGIIFHSTLNYSIQQKVTQIVNFHSKKLEENQIHNASALLVDIKQNKIIAYVGNSELKNNQGHDIDMLSRKRSPGSILKPFLYALAIDEGVIMPHELVPDLPVIYDGFFPKNHDGQYRGAVHVDQALASSLNLPFVHLLNQVGYEKFHHKLNEVGFYSLTKPAGHYGLSLILGGGEVTPIEVATVYTGAVNLVKNYVQRPINKPYANSDFGPLKIKEENAREKEVLTGQYTFTVSSLALMHQALTALERPFEESGWRNFTGQSSALSWKTGTSQGFRDGWAVGYTSSHLVLVWTGNASGEGRAGLSGISAAAPVLFDLLKIIPISYEPWQLLGDETKICSSSGLLAGPLCTSFVRKIIPESLPRLKVCTYHQLIIVDSTENFRVSDQCYPIGLSKKISRFVLPPAQAWFYKKHQVSYSGLPPYLEGCGSFDNFQIIYPSDHSKIYLPVDQSGQLSEIVFEAAHSQKTSTLYWYIDDDYIGSTHSTHKLAYAPKTGKHRLTLIDGTGNEIVCHLEILERQ